jgi:hypothetical protein
MKRIVSLLACLMIVPSGVQAGELFRWVDADGRVYYSDTPPTDAAKAERKKLSDDASQNEDLPYAARLAQQNFPVTLYVGSGCGETCDQARSLLTKRGIPFSERSLKTKEDVDAFKKLSGIEGVPVLAVGKTYLRGFLAEQWNSELDIAGYPKTASYRQRVAPPKKPAPETPPAEGQPEEGQQAPVAPAAQ